MPKKTNRKSDEEANKRANARANYAKNNGVFDDATGSYKIVKDSGKSDKGVSAESRNVLSLGYGPVKASSVKNGNGQTVIMENSLGKVREDTQSNVANLQKKFNEATKKLNEMRGLNSKYPAYKVYNDDQIKKQTEEVEALGNALSNLHKSRGETEEMYGVRSKVSNAIYEVVDKETPRSIGGVAIPEIVRQQAYAKYDDALYRKKADDIAKKYIGKEYLSNENDVLDFFSKWMANYSSGKLGEAYGDSGYSYASKPSEARKYYKDTVEDVQNAFLTKNAGTVGKGGIISKNLASYLPQLEGQLENSLPLALIGGAVGMMAGAPAIGFKLGYSLGSGRYSYKQMYGSSFNELLKITDFENAKKLARDEGLVSGGVETLDTLWDIASLGGGAVLKALGKEATEKIAKTSIFKLLGGYSLNVIGEGGQESIQELISIANERRAEKGNTDSGVIGLAGETVSLINEIFRGENDDALKRAKEAGIEGMKTAAVVGGASLAVNTSVANKLNGTKADSEVNENVEDDVYCQIADEDGQILDGGAVFYSNNSTDAETKSIKQQLREKIGDIMLSPAVANIKYDVTDGKSVNQMETEVLQILSEKGKNADENVVREGFGVVDLSYKKLKKGLKYLRTAPELYSLPYAADVVKKGVQIYYEGNHKSTGNESFTFAAPVNINGVPHAMGVVVQRSGITGGNKYHVHRVILPDGSSLILDEKKQRLHPGSVFQENERPVSPITAVSNAIISQDGGKNNKNMKKVYPGLTAADIESGNISEDLRVRLDNYKKVLQRFGFKVIYESHRVTPDKTIGYVDFTNKEVYLSPKHISEALLTHELTHIIDRGFGGKYVESLVSFFKKELSDDWNKKYESVKAKYEKIAEENPGFTYSESTLLAETLAEMCSEFTTDEYIKKAASMDVGTIKQIGLMLRYMGYKIKMIFGDASSAHKMKMASLKWQLALYRATKKGAVDDGNGIAYSGSSTKYDYQKSFNEQIEDYKNGVFPENDSLLLGATPEVWRKAGFNALPVTINQTHVDYAINGTNDADHYIGEAMLKQLPEAIKEPIAIIQSVTHPDRAVVILKLQHNGKSVILPIEVDGYGTQNNISIDSNAVTSVFGKNNAITQLADAVTHTVNGSIELFYWNKKEALSLLQTPGLQLPSHLPQDGFIHSIRENGSKVKVKLENVTESQQFKRWFGKSKVVDANGKPKVVYHGTDSRFSVFNSSENGYWFSDSYDYAESMAEERGGSEIMPVYLRMQSPYYAKLPEGKFSDPIAEKPILEKAKRKGCDGVIIECDTENELVYDKFYVVFDKTQIKSVDNIGTFDGDNPDINFSIATDQGAVKDVQSKKSNAGIDALKYYQKNADELLEERDTLEYLLKEGDLDVDERLAAKTKIHLIDKALSGKSKYVEDMVQGVPDKELTGKAKKVAETVRAYRETGDAREADKLPTKRSLKVSEKYRQGKIAEINRELNQLIRERNQDGVTDVQREELDVQINDRFAQLREIAKINEVYKQAYDILDEIDTAARPNHTWVGEISEWLADKKNLIKYGTYNLNDIERNFKIFFGEHFKKAYDKIIQPLYDSKKAYTEGVTEYANRLKEKIVDGLGIKKGSKASAAVMWLGEGQKPISKKAGSDLAPYTYRDCEAEFGAERAKDIKKAAEIFRDMYDELLDKVNETRAMLYPNNPDKLIPRREDYFRHFQEMSQGFEGLKNVLQTNIGIDPMLVGVSENTKPKSKWQSFAQSRTGNRTEYDAVGGFLDYLPAAMYSTHIDPNIVNVRSLAYDLASAKAEENGGSGNPNANGFIAYLQRYANSLAGKTTSHFDRAVQDSNFGRTAMAIVSWLNNKTKASAVLGNINSVLSQVTNIKNVIGKIEHQSDVVRGALDALAGLNSSGRVAKRYEDSGFLKERYIDRVFSQFDRGWDKVNPVKWAADVLGYADEIGTRITWNAGYNEAVRKGISNPVQYADNFTRSCVAGRGIGEEALVFKSQVAKMFLPFRTEVLNDLRVQQDILFGEEYDIWEKNDVKITPNMTETERYKALKNKTVKVAQAKSLVTENVTEEDIKRLETKYKSEARPILKKIVKDFDVPGMYTNENIELDFEFSMDSTRKSINEQKKNYAVFAKMFTAFNEVIENAVGIEVHKDKYIGTPREDKTLEKTYVLASAFSDGGEIYPVKLEVKKFNDGKNNKLYLAVVVNKKEDTFSVQTASQNDDASYTPVPSVISLSQLLNIVNDEDFDKYIPKQFKGDKKQDAFDEIVAMGKADGRKIKTNTARRVKNMMQLYIASMVVNAVIAAIKSDEFEPIEEAKEGYEEDGVLGALLSVVKDYADGIGDPVAFDPIYDIASGIYQGIEEGESAGGDVGRAVLRTAQNLSGDLVSNNPFSTAVMGMVGFDNDASKLLFNGNVYVPGGMGMPLASNAATVMRELGQGDYASAAAATVKPFLPLGTQADRSVKGFYEWSKGYATTESAYDRMAGQEGDLKYLIEKNPENFIKSLLFGPGAFSGESDAYYNDKTRKFSDEEQEKILSQPDYKSRKVTFDDILAMNKYDSERDERKQATADEFFQGKEGTILHNLYVSGEDAAIPYKNMAGESSFTDSKTGRQYTLALSASQAEKLTKEVNDKIAERFNRANGSDVFASMTKDDQVKYLEAVANAEYKQAKIKALYEGGQMGYEDYFRLESNHIETEAKRDRVLYVDDTSAYVEFNAADTVGQYISYSDVAISEEGYEQITQWRNYSSTRKADDVDRELMRLSNATGSDINVSGNPYGIISYSKNKVEYRIEMPDNQIYALCDEIDRAVRSALLSLFSKATYKNAIDEAKKDMVASVKRTARDKIKDKYKVKYKSVRVDEFEKILNMK